MSYQRARSRLANLLIRAKYDPTKVLKAVKYPYVEAIELVHEAFNGESQKFYQKEDTFVRVEEFTLVQDTEYQTRGGTQKVKAQVVVPDSTSSVTWASLELELALKYFYPYSGEIIDVFKKIGRVQYGQTNGGIVGIQEDFIPLPEGGWEQIIID